MAQSPLVFLAPSEGKIQGGLPVSWHEQHENMSNDQKLYSPRCRIEKALIRGAKQSKAQRQKFFGVKDTLLLEATEAQKILPIAPILPSIERYDGVLYKELDYRNQSLKVRKKIDTNVRIFSGLWGVLQPQDCIPWYKCKMSSTLPAIGPLATMWRTSLHDILLEESASRVVWNLLPQEHARAWNPDLQDKRSPKDIIRVHARHQVRRNEDIVWTAVTHWSKLLKGAVCAYVIANNVTTPDGLEGFSHKLGYVYDADASTSERIGNTLVSDVVLSKKLEIS